MIAACRETCCNRFVLFYAQDFQLQHLERKVARLQGERSNEEKVALNLKIKARDVKCGCKFNNKFIYTGIGSTL